jgi:hypothetical protein
MSLAELMIALALSLVLTLLFWWAGHSRQTWEGTYRLFLIIFLGSWAALLWMRPYQASASLLWTSLLVIGLFLAAALVPRRPPKNRRETKRLLEQIEKEKTLRSFFHIYLRWFFWPLVGMITLCISVRYLMIF